MQTLDYSEVNRVLDGCRPVNAERAADTLSDRYRFVSTRNVADSLGKLGWTPRKAFFIQSKSSTDPLYKKHCVRFTNARYSASKEDGLGGLSPEIVVTNAHDGTSSLKLDAGIFRMVCSNGLTIKEKDFETVRLRHDNRELNVLGDVWVNAVIRQFANDLPSKMASIDGWDKVELNREQRLSFYKKAGRLRDLDMWDYRYDQFDRALRSSDHGNDLWRVFNRTQEYLLHGRGLTKYYDFTDPLTRKIRKRELSPLTSVSKVEEINKALWDLTTETFTSLN